MANGLKVLDATGRPFKKLASRRKEILVPLLSALGGALIAAVATVSTGAFGYLNRDRELDIEMVNIALKILGGEIDEDAKKSEPARKFALNALQKYSGVTIESDDFETWVAEGVLPNATAFGTSSSTTISTKPAAPPAFDPSLLPSSGSIRMVTWNLESGESSTDRLAAQVAEKQLVSLWILSEVESEAVLNALADRIELEQGWVPRKYLSATGKSDRLGVLVDERKLKVLEITDFEDESFEEYRFPVVLRLKHTASQQSLNVIAVHFARGNSSRRLEQARKISELAKSLPEPTIVSGTLHFDYHTERGDDGERDQAFDILVDNANIFWVRPNTLVKTQASDSYSSILDGFVFSNPDGLWSLSSRILQRGGDNLAVAMDFNDDSAESDHRPVDLVMVPNQ